MWISGTCILYGAGSGMNQMDLPASVTQTMSPRLIFNLNHLLPQLQIQKVFPIR